MVSTLPPDPSAAEAETRLVLDSNRLSWSQILLVEDDASRATRRPVPGISNSVRGDITVCWHQIAADTPALVKSKSYDAGALDAAEGRASLALEMLDELGHLSPAPIVVAGTTYGSNYRFLCGLRERKLNFAVELPPSALVEPVVVRSWAEPGRLIPLAELLQHAQWTKFSIVHPTTEQPVDFLWADFGPVMRQGLRTRLLIVQTGNVTRLQPGTVFALVSDDTADPSQLINAVGWTRWIRPFVRKLERNARTENGVETPIPPTRLTPDVAVRVNITIARQQDEAARQERELPIEAPTLRGCLATAGTDLKVAELFAGAGGMGLGFLLAGQADCRYRLIFSGEVHPIYVETLKSNQAALAAALRQRTDVVPEQLEALDLRAPEVLARAERDCRDAGGVDILIGGPPCQGFSSANRNSGHSSNPHNQLVEVFLNYVERLRPRVFLMENVQGIVWTPKDSESAEQLSVADDFTQRTMEAGYIVFPKLLDAAWYGVPQHRNRFFILGISTDMGYDAEDFGPWGPFPRPTHGPGTGQGYVTVRQALFDLPHIWNGYEVAEADYCPPTADELEQNPFLSAMRDGAPERIIWDHVTSKHAAYVIDRYRRIPQGGNWENIAEMLTNYADIERTHSNIYRRLVWDEPSITIGHYRKSMIVHPTQDRGLSLREACRLQSFPDWFRFAGSLDGSPRGLTHKQQQLANAVCPLVTRAIAAFILDL